MKSYKTQTVNGGTTYILDDVNEAIAIGKKLKNTEDREKYWYNKNDKSFEQCCEDMQKGDPKLKERVSEIIEDLMGVVDDIQPIFSQAHSGYTIAEEGVITTPELIASGEVANMLRKKVTPFKLKHGKGDGIYRIIINTDVCWWGKPEENDAIVGGLILLFQRYGPVEVWIQQGWLGCEVNNGVTLFKLDYSSGLDITNLAFWINHVGKDIPFSWQINRALGRTASGTSQTAEIEADIMLRGDWQSAVGLTWSKMQKLLYTERLDFMAKWMAMTGMKVLTDEPEDLFPLNERPTTQQ